MKKVLERAFLEAQTAVFVCVDIHFIKEGWWYMCGIMSVCVVGALASVVKDRWDW